MVASAGANAPAGLEARYILGSRVDATSYGDAAERILHWSKSHGSRLVCVAAVSSVMIGHDERSFREIINGADLVVPDGMPLVWALRGLKIPTASRVRGTELTRVVLSKAAESGIPVGFYGGERGVLSSLVREAQGRWPRLKVAYSYSPPFRTLSAAEDEGIVADIIASGTRILFVGLGCPKQERWMAIHRDRIPPVMIGVGAAFDVVSGAKPEAPRIMQRTGLEWLFRLATEPRRLWKRYLSQNPRYLALIARQLWAEKRNGG
jgi:N-acetylglucosaminyldiphosphoundecaprenol N-acetyl-beta-D-mannosaminyltransferase